MRQKLFTNENFRAYRGVLEKHEIWKKIMGSGKNRTFERFGGTRLFEKMMIFGKDGTSEQIGGTEEYQKNMITAISD